MFPSESETQALIPGVLIGEFGSSTGLPELKSTAILDPKYHLSHSPWGKTDRGINKISSKIPVNIKSKQILLCIPLSVNCYSFYDCKIANLKSR